MEKTLSLLTLAVVSFLAVHAFAQSQPAMPGNAAAPRLDAWKVLGPGGGGTMIAPLISPHDSKTVLLHCDMTGAYITHNGGDGWRMFNLRAGLNAYAYDPSDAKILYAGNIALWKSSDGGDTWRMMWPNPAKGTVEHCVGDHGEARLSTEDASFPPRGEVSAIAVDPADGKHVVVAISGKLYESRDAAATFEPMHAVADAIETLTYTAHGALFAVGGAGLHREEGKGWATIDLPGQPAQPTPRNQRSRSVSIAWPKEQVQATIYVAGPSSVKDGKLAGGVFVSTDGGKSWTPTLGNLVEKVILPEESATTGPQDRQRMRRNRAAFVGQVTCCETNPLIAYAGMGGLRLGEGEAGLYNAIIKTSDGGKSWHVVHKESNGPSPTMAGSWFEKRASDGGRSVYFVNTWSLSCSPTDPNICYATDLFRTYMTSDGGTSWRQCHSAPVGEPSENRWATRGLDVTTCYGVHFDPFDHRNVYISYTDIGMFRSPDGGTSWISSIAGIPREWSNTTYWLEFDPKVKGLVWGAFSGTHDLPRPKMFRSQNPDNFRGGVATSTDGGKSWNVTNDGLPQTSVTHILLDSDSPVGSRTLYACGFGKGVYKSTDNGKSWSLKNHGLPQHQPFAWRIVKSPDKSLYLIIARRNETDENRLLDGENASAPSSSPASEPSAVANGAIYRSTDGAENWVQVNLPSGCTGPNGLAIDPTDAGRMYLAAWAQVTASGNQAGGVFGTTDGGKTWKQLTNMPHAYDVTIDPSDSKILYTCGFDAAAYRSADAGATWQRIKGYNFKWGHRVLTDPDRPDMIYITTFGGSLWHGPAKGDPNATDDIVQ